LREGQTEFLVRTVNELLRPEDLEGVVVDASQGAIVRLADVARVYKGHKERELITRINGREAVEVAVYKEGGTNTVAVSDAVHESLADLETRLKKLDPRLSLVTVTDQAGYIRQSVKEVLRTALYGGLLAIFVLFLFLRSWKTTLIISIAIPISVVATFFLMFVFGISLNIMSLGGITLGIGLLVDNAIVVLEAIQRRRDDGLDDVEAARAGAGEVSRAVVASTLTTICVFVPIVFVEGVAGQLFGDQALTVTFSLSVSLLVALTVIPMLASRKFVPGEVEREEAGGHQSAVAIWLADKVFRVIVAVIRAIKLVFLTLAIAFVLLAGSLTLFPRLGRELVPELIQGELFANLELPPGTHLDVTQRRLASLEGVAGSIAGVRTVYALAGASNEQGGTAGDKREHIGQITLILDPPISRDGEERTMEQLRVALDRQEDLVYRFGRPAYFSFRTPIEVEVRGYNLELLERLADELVKRLRGISGLTDIKSSTEGGSPELQIRFDRARLASLGLSIGDVAPIVRSKVQGTIATDIDRTIDIRVRADEAFRDSVEDLSRLVVVQRGRTAIPLSALASVEEVEGPAEIRRAEGERVAVITANLVGGHYRQPCRTGPGLGSGGDCCRHRGDRPAVRLRRRDWRPAPGNGNLVCLNAAGHRAGHLHGLPGDGLPVRELAAPVRDSLQRSLRRHRGAGDPLHHQHGHLGCRAHRGDSAGRHCGEQRHHSGGLHQPTPPFRDDKGGSAPESGRSAASPDHDDNCHDGAGPAADGHRARGRERAPQPHGSDGDWRPVDLHCADPVDHPGRLPSR
jgi:HAE1 family hydrophobic/amphiphilic exporter-1